jgi:hypothetical protein
MAKDERASAEEPGEQGSAEPGERERARLRRGPGATPLDADRLDELLDAPPRGDHHLGRFAGYRAASPIRRRIALALGLCVVIMGVAYWQVAAQFEAKYERQRWERLHPYELPAGTDVSARPRELTWTTGKARLGLRRETPGVAVIHLPDRDLVLAPGSDHAQLNVEVRDGKVIYLKVLFGTVEERPPGSVHVDPPPAPAP